MEWSEFIEKHFDTFFSAENSCLFQTGDHFTSNFKNVVHCNKVDHSKIFVQPLRDGISFKCSLLSYCAEG